MSSRRKQSKPIGFVAEGSNVIAPNAGAEDDTSSRSSHTSSHTSSTRSYSSSSNNDSADTYTNSKKEDTASPTDVEATTNQKATSDKSMTNDLPLEEEAMPSKDPVSEDATAADDSSALLKVASVKDIGDEDLRAPSTNPVVDALMEGDAKEDSLEPGEVAIPTNMKRKRLDESGLSLTLSQNGETGDVFEYPDENMGDFTENLDDDGHQDDEEYDEDE